MASDEITKKQQDIFAIRDTISASIGAVETLEEQILAFAAEKEDKAKQQKAFFNVFPGYWEEFYDCMKKGNEAKLSTYNIINNNTLFLTII